MSDDQTILEKIKKIATANGYKVTKYAPRIAKAKAQFFGVNKWARCPCDPESDRACISTHCCQDIAETGTCHCKLYERID